MRTVCHSTIPNKTYQEPIYQLSIEEVEIDPIGFFIVPDNLYCIYHHHRKVAAICDGCLVGLCKKDVKKHFKHTFCNECETKLRRKKFKFPNLSKAIHL